MKKNVAKGYEKTKPKQTQFKKEPKMNANAFSQKDYKNETAFRPKKTNPKQTQFKSEDRGQMSEIRCLRHLQFIADSDIIIEL